MRRKLRRRRRKKKSIFKYIIFLIITILGIIFFKGDDIRLKLGDYNSKSIYVYNLTDDKEELSLNATNKRAPASLVKIMTTYLALQNLNDISEIAPIDETTYIDLINNNASIAGFASGESTSFRDLLYGTMLPSGGEAANSLAINISEDLDLYIDMMNEKAKELNLKDTVYKSVEGFDHEGQYTTAKDTAKLLKEALNDDDFRAIFTRREYVSTSTEAHPDGVYMQSTIFKHLNDYEQSDFEIIGGKSGTTKNAGLNWVTLATKNEKEYLVVVMGVDFDSFLDVGDGHIIDTLRILEEIY